MSNLYVSAIFNFQASRGRPLEYYTTPLNDFSKHNKNLVVYVDDKSTYNRLSPSINRKLVSYQTVSNFDFEESWKSMFLDYFKNDKVWYNLSRTYLLKPKIVKMTKDQYDFERYVWLDAGMPCSHIYGHNYTNYKNLYTQKIVDYIDDVFSKHRFLSQGWVVHQQSGVNMKIVYDTLQLQPDGREHVSGCVFSLEKSLVDKFNVDFYDMLSEFHKINFPGTDENVYIAMMSKDKKYCDAMYNYNDFTKKLTEAIKPL
jgi:hypothetical protein